MAAKGYTLEFDGYYRDENKGGLPADSGVYCVYTCIFNQPDNTVSLNRLLYIGEAADVRARVANHERAVDWARELKRGEQLCFSFAPISPADRARAEAAMIFEHKPVLNVQYKWDFPFDTTRIVTKGKNALLTPDFTVYRT